ncbi:MAG: TM2 domain-containing protein [Candidatus Saccharibacteria bacterium]|nr:TM2 domain-containing protein [Candidatus Saccharibacteria bacterium]
MEPQTPQQTPTVATTPAPQTSSEPRNLLAAMLLTLSFGTFGLHQLYLGRKTQAWIRFALGFVALIPVLGVIFSVVLGIWAFVDFITIYKGHTDGDGQPLVATKRDAFTAKLLFILAMILIGIIVVGIVLATIIVAVSGIQHRAAQS